jgi:starch phosphorylase
VSSLDGWWEEAYSEDVGWALGDKRDSFSTRYDAADAEQLYKLLEEQIVPLFYNRDAAGVPREWIAKMRASMAKLAPHYSSNRMLRDYVEQIYLPAAETYHNRVNNNGGLAVRLRQWEQLLKDHWEDLHFGNLQIAGQNDCYDFELQVYLGDISPDSVQVQLYAKAINETQPYCHNMQCDSPIPGTTNGYVYKAGVPADRPAQDYTARIIPYFPGVQVPAELSLIYWQK